MGFCFGSPLAMMTTTRSPDVHCCCSIACHMPSLDGSSTNDNRLASRVKACLPVLTGNIKTPLIGCYQWPGVDRHWALGAHWPCWDASAACTALMRQRLVWFGNKARSLGTSSCKVTSQALESVTHTHTKSAKTAHPTLLMTASSWFNGKTEPRPSPA